MEDTLQSYAQNNSSDLQAIFSKLSIAQPKLDVNSLEWTGKAENERAETEQREDEDETSLPEETKLIKIMNSTNQTDKIIVDKR